MLNQLIFKGKTTLLQAQNGMGFDYWLKFLLLYLQYICRSILYFAKGVPNICSLSICLCHTEIYLDTSLGGDHVDLKAGDKNTACFHGANYLNHTCSCSAPSDNLDYLYSSMSPWLNLHALYEGTEYTELEHDVETFSNYTWSLPDAPGFKAETGYNQFTSEF